MNTCEDCGLKHQGFSLDCPQCCVELTHYTEPGSLSYEVSFDKGTLVFTILGVDMYDDFDGSFFCSHCQNY